MVWSIISIFLCWILAIFAIIKSSEVNTKLAQGDYLGAKQASDTAKTLNIIALVIGIFGCLAQIGYVIALIAAAASSGSF